MEDPEVRENRAELISRMFALLTAKLEDAATIAADCQGRHPIQQLFEGAGRLEDYLAEASIVTAAVAAILRESPDA